MHRGAILAEESVYRAFHVGDRDSLRVSLGTSLTELTLQEQGNRPRLPLQDLLHCIILSEGVYRAHEGGPIAATAALNILQESLHPSLSSLQSVQYSLPHVHHR